MIIINTPHDGDILYKNLKNSEKKYYEEKKNLIVNNVFLDKKYVAKFRSWIKHNNKITNIVKKFYYNLKKTYTYNKNPVNEEDLTCELYNKNNKNIYIYDFENKRKWWFSLKNICKLINNCLCYFDEELYSISCKNIINPYTGASLTYQSLLSIYEQLKTFDKIPNLFVLFKQSNFDIEMFKLKFDHAISDYGAKYIIPTLNDTIIMDLFINTANILNINYISHIKLEYYYPIIKHSLIDVLQWCYFSYNSRNEKIKSLKVFINEHRFIMKKIRIVTPTLDSGIENSDNNQVNEHFDDDNENSNDSEEDSENLQELPALNNSPTTINDSEFDFDIEVTTSIVYPNTDSINLEINEQSTENMELSEDDNESDCNDKNSQVDSNNNSDYESDCNDKNSQVDSNNNSDYESDCNDNSSQSYCNNYESDYSNKISETESYSDSDYETNKSDDKINETESSYKDYEGDSTSESSFNSEWEELNKEKDDSGWETDSNNSKFEKMSLDD